MPDDVEMVFVPEATEEERGGYFSTFHLYSARVLDSLREHYGNQGPDLVEFSDYLGEGAVTVQARRARDPLLRQSAVAIRLHTTAEICAVLDGYVDDAFASRITFELERLALRDADYLVWSGGDTLGLYHRLYGRENVAPASRIRYPAMHTVETGPPPKTGDSLRLVFLGRLERRKGVHKLLRALNFIETDELQLDVLGADTDTGPLGTSLGAQLDMMAAGDSRIRIHGPVPREDVPKAIKAASCVVLPSLWENWPFSGLEALRLNRPLVTTPVGGFTEMVKPGVTGWHTKDMSTGALVDLLERLVARRDQIERLVTEERPAGLFVDLTDPDEILNGYCELVSQRGRWDSHGRTTLSGSRQASGRRPLAPRASVASPRPPLVSLVIPYFRMEQHIEEAVKSALEQTHQRLEVIVVNDGSNSDGDWLLAELAVRYPIAVVTQVNSGLGAARNFGISQARGRFVVPFDADDILSPAFVERSVEAIEGNPDAAYVTTWSRYMDEAGQALGSPNVGYQPIGNWTDEVLRNNVAGSAVSLLRRWLFDRGFSYSEDLTSYEDWHLYQQLHSAGHFGIVIPDRLFDYRIRDTSMTRQIAHPQLARLDGELKAHLREGKIEWTSLSD
jgi:glycogen(starch) synthase